MLVPASVYKNHIEQQFKKIQYSDKYLWYTGSIDNYDLEVKTEGDKFAFAIVFQEALIGYVSFRVDWYCSMAYNFSLIKFKDTVEYFYGDSPDEYRLISTAMIMADAIREVMRMIKSFNLHRIDFRCVSGNPALCKYDDIIDIIEKTADYWINKLVFKDNIRDTHGNYHDTIVYELIGRTL